MNRVRIGFGLLIVIVGTAWLSDGPAAVRSGGRWTLTALPYLLLGLGLFLLLRAAVPRGLLAAPVVLILTGVLWVVHDSGHLGGTAGKTWPGIVILLGAAIALGAAPAAAHDRDEGPLRRYRSVIMPVRPELVESTGPLQKITAASYMGDVRLELSTVRFQADSTLNSFGFSAEVLEIDVTVLFGRVTILLDHRCAVVKGNVANSLAVHFADQVRVYATTDIYADDAVRTRTPRRILLNVIGVGGTVDIRSR
ncbi:hypothetical protein [Streptomyces griseorubiginosus]|uniref:hypothetical protein n=1 Tax=Streptomyces griseorubiginosus TaxID=67304 RepID=UPI003653E2E5